MFTKVKKYIKKINLETFTINILEYDFKSKQ